MWNQNLIMGIKILIGVILLVVFLIFIRYINNKKIKKNKDRKLGKNLTKEERNRIKEERKRNKEKRKNEEEKIDNFNPANLSCECPTFEYIVDGSEMRARNPEPIFRDTLESKVKFEEPDIKHAELSEVEDDGVSLQVRRNILNKSKNHQESKRKMDMESVGYSMESGDSKKNKEKDQSLSGVEIKTENDKENYVIM